MTILEELFEEYPDTVKMDGFDDCIVGVASRYGMECSLVYDLDKVISRLMDDGATYEEAVEYHEFNQLGAWVGETTPVFIQFLDEDYFDLDDVEDM